jgi:hypothetical protein
MSDLLDDRSNGGGPVTPGTLPNATATLVMGIIAIVGCFLYAIPGLICGIIALFLHRKDKNIYLSNPEKYDASYKTSRAGFICAIVGVSLSVLWLVILLIGFFALLTNARF